MSDPNFSAIRARLKYASIDAFIDGYSRFISSGGMFIPMAPEKLKPIGTTIRFQFLLNDGTTALLGEGTVLQVRPPDDSKPNAPVGMLVKFAKLSQESKKLVDRIVAEKEAANPLEEEVEVVPARDPTAASDDPTGEFTQEQLAQMAADQAPQDPPTREAPSAEDLLDDEEDEIALELERVDEEVRKEGGPRRLAGTDGGISVFAFDDMSDDDLKDFENFSFGGDEDEIDSMFDGLFGGGDGEGDGGLFGGGADDDGDFFGGGEDDDGDFFGGGEDDDEAFFGDDAVADADTPFGDAEPEEESLGDEETFDAPVEEVAAAAAASNDVEEPLPPVNDEPGEPAFEIEPVAEPEDLEEAAEEEDAELDEDSEPFELKDDFDAPATEIGHPASVADDAAGDEDEDVDLDFPEFDSAGPSDPEIPAGAVDDDDEAYEDFDEPVEELVEEEVEESEEEEPFFDEDDEIDFPMAEEDDDVEAIELDSSVSFVEEIIEDDEDEELEFEADDEDEFAEFAEEDDEELEEKGSGVYDLIGSLDDDEEEELSLNIGHGALAQQEEEPEGNDEPDDEESLEALLASAQKEIESKRGDEDEVEEEGDIIDQLLGDDDELPPPPPDMPAFQLPDGNSKKKKGGFISKLFGKD